MIKKSHFIFEIFGILLKFQICILYTFMVLDNEKFAMK